MAERSNEQKNFFKNLHTDQYKWNDFFLIPLIVTIVMMFVGQTGVLVISNILMKPIINDNNVDFLTIFQQYFTFLGVWIIALLYCYFTKKNRPIINALTPFCKGNTVKYLLLGLLIGFAQNAFCIMVALLHKDIHIYFDSLNLLQVIPLFIVVFIQSSAEELLCRGFLYQRLRRGYKNPAIAVVGNALLFSLLHAVNPGVSPLALLSIFFVGLLYSLMVYYCDSIWMPMAAHAAWNFTQNIIFGLPNSGNVSPVSIFKLDASTAMNSFAYDVGFGVEATIVAIALIIVSCIIVYLWGSKNNKKPTEIWN
jgi:membrane protease YdiL (CAAX protease family)